MLSETGPPARVIDGVEVMLGYVPLVVLVVEGAQSSYSR
jgi:hypothetical protein